MGTYLGIILIEKIAVVLRRGAGVAHIVNYNILYILKLYACSGSRVNMDKLRVYKIGYFNFLQFSGCCRLLRRREIRRAAAPCKESLYSYARSHYAGGNKHRA